MNTSPGTPPSRPPSRPRTALVVEDSVISAKRLTAVLVELGFQIAETCNNGRSAIEAYQRLRPDLVTMDVTMPELDGVSATRAIMQIDPEARIVMITAQGQEQLVLEALQAGARSYLLKPVQRDHLQAVLQQVLGG